MSHEHHKRSVLLPLLQFCCVCILAAASIFQSFRLDEKRTECANLRNTCSVQVSDIFQLTNEVDQLKDRLSSFKNELANSNLRGAELASMVVSSEAESVQLRSEISRLASMESGYKAALGSIAKLTAENMALKADVQHRVNVQLALDSENDDLESEVFRLTAELESAQTELNKPAPVIVPIVAKSCKCGCGKADCKCACRAKK
jgi:chromosome segregation ATPase